MAMVRRGFLALTGGAFTGLFVAPSQLIAAPRSLVLHAAGSCSFCGKYADEVLGLTGIRQKPARICNECIALCLDILHEAGFAGLPRLAMDWRRPSRPQATPALEPDVYEALLAKVDALIRAYENRPPKPITHIVCSFCDTDKNEVAKMIAGPSVFICDACTAGAATLFGSCHAGL